MNEKPIRLIFWITVGVFIIVILSIFSYDLLGGRFTPGYIVLPALAILLGLGIALIVLTVKKQPRGIRKTFLILTGASAAGIPVFAVLHNLVYALLILLFGEDFWGAGDEPVFFTLAVTVSPVGFLVGAAGTIALAIKDWRSIMAGSH